MNEENPYCTALGIKIPSLEVAKGAKDKNTYALLIVALLEKGEPMTLDEAADRFEMAGVSSYIDALNSLKKCRPARPPIHRDGDLYALDPYHDETDLWVFRLGLRPPKVAPLRLVPPDPPPLPPPEKPVSVEELKLAWKDGIPSGWSAQRVAIAILEAYDREMSPEEVIAIVSRLSQWSPLRADSAKCWRSNAAVAADEDSWHLKKDHPAVRSMRIAVRDSIQAVRRRDEMRPNPVANQAARALFEREVAETTERYAAMRRCIVVAFPQKQPSAVTLLDVDKRELATFFFKDIGRLKTELADYDSIAGVDVRAILSALDFDPEKRRLCELSPPQKSKTLNRRGKKLKITLDLLVKGTCGISRPFADPVVMQKYLESQSHSKLQKRLESDAKSLFAFYQYGRLHGSIRLRWGFLDENLLAPWVHRMYEKTLYNMMQEAHQSSGLLKVVTGSAPGWKDPWARSQIVSVEREEPPRSYSLQLIDENGYYVDEADIQLAEIVLDSRSNT